MVLTDDTIQLSAFGDLPSHEQQQQTGAGF
jgi:hypothetical protein